MIKEIYINEDNLIEATISNPNNKQTSNKKGKGANIGKKPTPDEEMTKLSDTATYGFFRQHGKQHTTRTLSPFNLHLVNTVFEKAGITPEFVKFLAEKRAEMKSQKANVAGM